MNNELIPFTTAELAFIGAYLASLLVIGWIGLRARKEHSLLDFYLGGKGIGLFVLVLTLYATQYSGNSMFGYTGKAYRIGYPWMMSVHFMTAIVVFYLLLAPRLHALSKKQGFITPTDYLEHRFHSRAINVVATVVMLVAIANYLLAQMMAMGRALQGLIPQHSHNAYIYGVILLALIIVVYETMGGFRAVAWTDMIQGSILLVGLLVLLGLVCYYVGTPAAATRKLMASGPESVAKIVPPDTERCREWLSYIVVVGVGGALYPQAIQRIYAARSAATLRRSLAVMAFLPMTACLITVLVGVIAAAYEPGLEAAESDKILTVVCRQIQQQSLFGRWFVAVLFAAILAAVMSTADSVLLSISSMLTKDLYGRFARPQASQRELALVGKICSWATIAVAVHLAIVCRNMTLMQILDRKFDILVQLGPAFFLGLHWPRLRGGPVLLGLVAGVAIAVTLALCGYGKIAGVHAGVYGLGVNLVIVLVGTVQRVHVAIVGTLLGLLYLAGAPIVMQVSIRWPAPYWFAIGLNAMGIVLLVSANWRNVLFAVVVGVAAYTGMWYAEIGVYHVFGLEWAYSPPWCYLLKAPSYLLLAAMFLLGGGRCRNGVARGSCAAVVYLFTYLAIMLPAPFVCSIALRRCGTFLHGNYDDFGYRLGIYSLAASLLCVLVARRMCLSKQEDPITTQEARNHAMDTDGNARR